MSAPRPRLAVLVSGSGRSLANLAERAADGRLPAEVALVIASKPGIGALAHAQRHGLESLVVDPGRELDPGAYSRAVFEACEGRGIDLVVLAGFLRFLPIPARWEGRVLNIHPSLLPAFGGQGFYGERVHRAVLERGCQVSGCTVHYATNEYDAGPILVQRAVPVFADDTPASLAARVFEQELEALPQAIELALARARPS